MNRLEQELLQKRKASNSPQQDALDTYDVLSSQAVREHGAQDPSIESVLAEQVGQLVPQGEFYLKAALEEKYGR